MPRSVGRDQIELSTAESREDKPRFLGEQFWRDQNLALKEGEIKETSEAENLIQEPEPEYHETEIIESRDTDYLLQKKDKTKKRKKKKYNKLVKLSRSLQGKLVTFDFFWQFSAPVHLVFSQFSLFF